MPYEVENMVRKGEIARYRQFLRFSQCFPQLSHSHTMAPFDAPWKQAI